MKIIEELQRTEIDNLRSEWRNCRDGGHVLESIDKKHCYQVHLNAEDYNIILINASIEERDLDWPEYPTIKEVIDSINKTPSFLNQTNPDRRLDGQTVSRYCEEFKQKGNKPESFFLVDRDNYPGMNPKGLFYVRDGMHHLVAYGLSTSMDENGFPIIGIYSSNNKRTQ